MWFGPDAFLAALAAPPQLVFMSPPGWTAHSYAPPRFARLAGHQPWYSALKFGFNNQL
jgi:hypothetical protein